MKQTLFLLFILSFHLAACTLPATRITLPNIEGVVQSDAGNMEGARVVVCAKGIQKFNLGGSAECEKELAVITDRDGRFHFDGIYQIEMVELMLGKRSVGFSIMVYMNEKKVAELSINTKYELKNDMFVRCYVEQDKAGTCNLYDKFDDRFEHVSIGYSPRFKTYKHGDVYVAHLQSSRLEDFIEHGMVEFTHDDVTQYLNSLRDRKIQVLKLFMGANFRHTSLIYIDGNDLGTEFIKKGYARFDSKYADMLEEDVRKQYESAQEEYDRLNGFRARQFEIDWKRRMREGALKRRKAGE